MNPNLCNIIVIGYNLPSVEDECLQSIVHNTKYRPYILTYFDNYESGLTLTQAWNEIIRSSDAEFICLLNSDCIVYPDWLTRLVDVVSKNSKISFSGPATTNCHSPQRDYTYELSESYLGKEDEFVYMQEQHLSGFCLCMRKKVWEEIGGFDERYFLYGQESAAQDAAYALNYKSVFVRSAFVHHIGEASVKASGMDVEKERTRAKKLYWSEREKG